MHDRGTTCRARVRDEPALWEGGGCELTSVSRGPKPKHSQQPPGVVQNWSALQCSKKNTEQCGYDHAPVTRGRMRARFPLPHGPHVEAVVLALPACAAVAVVGSTRHHEKGSAVRLQGLRHMEFNECEAVVVGHKGFWVQERVTQGPHHTLG